MTITSWTDSKGGQHVMTGKAGIADLTDDGLTRLARTYRHAIEDGGSAKMYGRLLEVIRRQRLSRMRLKMRYGAVDNHAGTDSYDRWYRLDEPPTYRLAAVMDHQRFLLGQRHVLAWTTEAGESS
jgi:hypothetical protein